MTYDMYVVSSYDQNKLSVVVDFGPAWFCRPFLPDTCLWLCPLRTADKPVGNKQVGDRFEFLAFCDAIKRAKRIVPWMRVLVLLLCVTSKACPCSDLYL